MSADSESPSAPPASHSGVRVEVKGLRKSYDGHLVLKGSDFTVEREEIFVIMAPSGSGKSVLLKHIIGLGRHHKGEILLEGQPIVAERVPGKYAPATDVNCRHW